MSQSVSEPNLLATGGGDQSRFFGTVSLVMLTLAGLLAIVGVVLGLLGASLARRGCGRARIGIVLNAIGWVVVAVIFLASFGG
jgi:uncharacterized membrane protein